MPRGVRIRKDCIEMVKLALRHSCFSRQIDLAEALNLSKNTVNSFLNGKPVEHLNFVELCQKLSLNWQDVANLDNSDEEIAQEGQEVPFTTQALHETVKVDNQGDVPPLLAQKRVVGLEALPSVPVWVGRDELLEELKAKLLEPGTSLKVLALIGQGAIGKTSLAAKLLEAVGLNLRAGTLATDSPYECVICFKAKEGTSFDEVAEFLFKGLDIEMPEPLKAAAEKITKILAGLAQERCLLLLDNLEAILHPASHPQAGRGISPDWAELLNALAYCNHRSQLILTSREVPLDLADSRSGDSEPDSDLVCKKTIEGVPIEAGIEILRRKLKDSEEDLRWVTERVGGNPLVLKLLADYAKDKPGYLRNHPELVTNKAEPIVREQLARQSEAARDLLCQICVLRVGIDIRGLTFLRLYRDDWKTDNRFVKAVASGKFSEFTNEERSETEAIVQRLLDSSLVQRSYDEQKGELFYDLHRLIVEFLQAEYETEVQNSVRSVYWFYQTIKNVENPKSLEDLQPILEAQYFAFKLGNYRESAYLLVGTLTKYLKFWGYWNLFKDLYEQILPYVDEAYRSICLMSLGIIHRDFGNWNVAERYFRDALSIERQRKNEHGTVNPLGLLGEIECNRGNWEVAKHWHQQALRLSEKFSSQSSMAWSLQCLGDIERHCGNWDEAERLYRQSLELRTQLQLRTEIDERPNLAITTGCLGKVELGRGNLDVAESLLKDALAKMQQLGMTWHIAEANYDLAQLERQRGNRELAQEDYNTARQIFRQLGAAKDLERIEREW